MLSLLGCGEVILKTTDETAANSNTSITDAGVVNDTFYVSGRSLMDPCGNPVVLRGVNEMPTFVFGATDGSTYFGEITQTHANAIRLYWQTSDTAEDLDRLLLNAEAKRMIAVIYVFNPDPDPSTTFSNAADYWTRSDIRPIILKHRQWLILALRERSASGTALSPNDWATTVDSVVERIRQQGINVPLAIDAPQFGLDTVNLVQLGSKRILADPRQNIIFSLTAWWANTLAPQIRSNIVSVTDAGLPVLLGEFSGWAQAAADCQNVTYDYGATIQVAQELSLGWFAWSWGAARNTQPCTTFNMTGNGTYASLYDWGYQVASAAANNALSIPSTSVPPTFVPGAGCAR